MSISASSVYKLTSVSHVIGTQSTNKEELAPIRWMREQISNEKAKLNNSFGHEAMLSTEEADQLSRGTKSFPSLTKKK